MLKELFNVNIPIIDTPQGDVKTILACSVPKIVSKKGNSLCVEMMPPKATRAMKGYFFDETPLAEVIKTAEEKNIPILLRFEKQRLKGIDKTLSIVDLTADMATAQKNVISACVGAYNFSTESWVSGTPHAIFSQDPPEIQAIIEEVKMGGDQDIETFFDNPEKNVTVEKPVFIPNPTNFDKKQHLITIFYLLKELENKYDYKLKDEKTFQLSLRILAVIDELYKVIKEVNVVDYKDFAHSRARYMIFNYESHLNNLTKDKLSSVGEWLEDAYKFNKKIVEFTNSI